MAAPEHLRRGDTRTSALRRRLLISGAAVFVPLAALLAYHLYGDRAAALADARRSVVDAAHSVADHHERLLERGENLAAMLASLPPVRTGERDLANQIFADITRRFPEYPNIRLSDLDGRMVASALPDQPASSNKGRVWFDEVLGTSNFAISGYFLGVSTRRPVVVVGYPVLNEQGRIGSVLSVTIDLANMAAGGDSTSSDELIVVIGRDNAILSASPSNTPLQGQPANPALIASLQRGGSEGYIECDCLDRTRRVVGYVAVPVATGSQKIFVAVGVPVDKVLAPVNRALLLNGTGVALALTVMLLVGSVGSRALIAPVTALVDVMSRLSGGDLSARTPEALRRDATEFGRLALSLDDLAAQLQLRDTERANESTRLRNILDAYFGFVVMLGPGNIIEEINAAPLEAFGLARADVVGRNFAESTWFSPEQRAHVTAMATRAFGGEVARGEVVANIPEIGERIIDACFSPLRNADGAITRVVAFAIDITAQRLLEGELRQAQKIEAIGTLSAGIAHDFNNVLAAVFTNTDLARHQLPAGHPAAAHLAQITAASERGRDLVRKILSFSRNRTEARVRVEPGAIVAEVAGLLRQVLPAGIEFAVESAPDLPEILADPIQLHQVVMNLSTNAWQAIVRPTGRIAIRLDAIAVTEAAGPLATLKPGRYLRIRVSDDGAGMDERTLERVFEPFFTTKGVGAGTGLGLAVVHGIITRHGGAVTVQSKPGQGSTFDVYLPEAPPAVSSVAAEPHPDIQAALTAAPPAHVLYVEDEMLVLMGTKGLLQRLGLQVTDVTRATDALEAVRSDPRRYDIVLTDQNMPGMSGLELARELAAVRPDLPVILTSGMAVADGRELPPNVQGLLDKPYTDKALGRAIFAALEHGRPAPVATR